MSFRGLRVLGAALLAGVLISAPTHSYAAGHFGGGGGHVGGFGGFHGGGAHGYGGYRGGYGGFRGGYGYGYRGGYWGGYGWGWGWPGYGLFLATLPLYYSTLWWDGLPYYYADDNYYVWNGAVGQYQSVPPPPIANQAANQGPYQGTYPGGGMAPGNSTLYAYPKNGQSEEQQARDRQECRGWAATQGVPSGAASASPGATGAGPPPNPGDNLRAQAACLEGRGYSVR
jgi:hypothetical protein